MDYKTRSNDSSPIVETPTELPRIYGIDTLVLMGRDPWCAFVYWEVTEKRAQEALDKAKSESQHLQIALRVYDVTGDRSVENAHFHFDHFVGTLVGSWYLHLDSPQKTFVAEIGYLTENKIFFPLVRSNSISFPRADVADLVDSDWMVVEEEFAKIYRVSGGGKSGPSSPELAAMTEELRRLIARRMSAETGSGGLFGSVPGSGSHG